MLGIQYIYAQILQRLADFERACLLGEIPNITYKA